MKKIFICLFVILFLFGCKATSTQETKDMQKVAQQQAQFAKGQPIPMFDWSLERHLVIEL